MSEPQKPVEPVQGDQKLIGWIAASIVALVLVLVIWRWAVHEPASPPPTAPTNQLSK